MFHFRYSSYACNTWLKLTTPEKVNQFSVAMLSSSLRTSISNWTSLEFHLGYLGQNLLLVDLRDFFFRFRGGDEKNSSENDQLTGHIQRVF